MRQCWWVWVQKITFRISHGWYDKALRTVAMLILGIEKEGIYYYKIDGNFVMQQQYTFTSDRLWANNEHMFWCTCYAVNLKSQNKVLISIYEFCDK